jgi:exopolysaccharide production protein ExoY
MKHESEALIFEHGTAVNYGKTSPPVCRGPGGFYANWGKRLCDLVLIAIFAPAFLLLILPLSMLVMRDGGQPFFGHPRIGRNGKPFRCWKIRSMVSDAPSRLERYLAANPEAKAEWDANFKLENDPRITRLGNFLRRSSLDELPQLWNILRGEMSWVGPRPVTEAELLFYGTAAADYRAMRPGLTGLWQVSGRNDISYAERVALDVTYGQRCSLWMDLKVIAKTVLAVLARTGR